MNFFARTKLDRQQKSAFNPKLYISGNFWYQGHPTRQCTKFLGPVTLNRNPGWITKVVTHVTEINK